jgi:predicted nucleic acid-binding protein
MPVDPVFLDTNGWLALLNASDSLHSAASFAWAGLLDRGGRVVLTDWIVAETGNGLARSGARSRFAAAVELIRSSPRADLVHVSQALCDRALELYTRTLDKAWGLIDCASFLVMEDQGISQAFTPTPTARAVRPTNQRRSRLRGRCTLPFDGMRYAFLPLASPTLPQVFGASDTDLVNH